MFTFLCFSFEKSNQEKKESKIKKKIQEDKRKSKASGKKRRSCVMGAERGIFFTGVAPLFSYETKFACLLGYSTVTTLYRKVSTSGITS